MLADDLPGRDSVTTDALLEGLCTPISADVLVDMPGVVTVARVYYETHTEYELTYAPGNLGHDDCAAALAAVPMGAMFLGYSTYEIEGTEYGLVRYCASTRIADMAADSPQSIPQEFSSLRRAAARNARAALVVACLLVVTFFALSWFDHPHHVLHHVAHFMHLTHNEAN